ncbi:ABC transporter permease subunit [Luxibacter massiliensis]|uniref:ABC transporter permease subunit n=1 Tax=Luxibacter massiliensis TaxID=2219695 RepID=UPI000F062970|nr:ABC transporter permease subunit [Luxibacter massiliensis]
MKQLTAFIKKEFLGQIRGGRFMILGILFCLFGIMNPATAKMLPWLLEIMSEQLAENGMFITGIEVDALTSWTQFFKNMPVLLIVFIVMFSGILTAEYQKGTLINVIAKGLKRWKILISKLLIMFVAWTAGYLITFGITYGYNAYFWDNHIVQNLLFAAFGYYLVGVWLISIILLASVILKSASAVILLVGAAFVISYLNGFLPAFQEYVPTYLLNSDELLMGILNSSRCMAAVGITVFLTVFNGILSVLIFNKKRI